MLWIPLFLLGPLASISAVQYSPRGWRSVDIGKLMKHDFIGTFPNCIMNRPSSSRYSVVPVWVTAALADVSSVLLVCCIVSQLFPRVLCCPGFCAYNYVESQSWGLIRPISPERSKRRFTISMVCLQTSHGHLLRCLVCCLRMHVVFHSGYAPFDRLLKVLGGAVSGPSDSGQTKIQIIGIQ